MENMNYETYSKHMVPFLKRSRQKLQEEEGISTSECHKSLSVQEQESFLRQSTFEPMEATSFHLRLLLEEAAMLMSEDRKSVV